MYLGPKDLTPSLWLLVLHIFREIKDFLSFQVYLENIENYQKKSLISLKICATRSYKCACKSLGPRYIDSYQNEHLCTVR